MAEVHVTRLTKSYGGAAAVDNLDLHVPEGEFVTLLGPSGCGKSTTLRCIAGLEVPDDGEIRIGSSVAFSATPRAFIAPEKRDIGMVFQSYALWPHMSVFNNVAYPLKVRGVQRSEVRTRVHEMLELVGLGHLATRSATALSGGQQQRVALARALVSRPRLLLFDEPLSNLDATLRAAMRSELRAIHARTGTTSICVTHDQIEALTLSDRVVVMRSGQVQQTGRPEAIFSQPANRFVAGFVGYDNFLPGTVVERGADRLSVRIDDTSGAVFSEQGADGVSVGDRVEVGVRSSAVQLAESPAGEDGDGLPATVVDRAYLGEHIQFVLDVAGRRLNAVMTAGAAADPSRAGLVPGARATVTIPAGSTVCFPHEDAPRPISEVSGVTGLPLAAEPAAVL